MAILDKLFHRPSEFDAHTMIVITETGNNALDQDVITDPNDYDILSLLSQHSPRSLSDLTKESQKKSMGLIKNRILKLQSQKMVKIQGD